MTNEQKSIIQKMRMKNETYAAISDAVGIPIGTIKSYFHRHTPICNNTNMTVCKNCGNDIKNKPKVKTRLFCCSQCRQKWWNAHRVNRQSEKMQPYVCAICEKKFVDYIGANRKYCSQTCYRKRGEIDG